MVDKNILPELGLIRLPEVLKIIPVGKSTWWQGIKTGRFPKPVKLGKRVSAWRVEDIRLLVADSNRPNFFHKDGTQNGK